jgi:phosphate:Na+ symporter
MNGIFDLWQLLAGTALFMLGMRMLEDATKKLSGRNFKLFLRRHTAHKFRAMLSGAAVTALLQSSSIVNLMVLAFVGAGVMSMNNALAVMLGSNLGTTLTGWFVATVGFKVDIEAYALPVVGVAGILVTLFRQDSKLRTWCSFLLGIGLLFVGLGFMKSSVASAVDVYDFSNWSGYPSIVFLLAGIIITSVIQSSSATVAIVLSMLYAQVIGLHAAMAVVLGSEAGTTVKLLIASAGGNAIKKRVALGNFLINIIGIIFIFLFLSPVNKLITGVVGIKDSLIALTFFQSFVNFVSIIIFYPFLNVFSSFLNTRFKEDEHLVLYINKVPPAETGTAIAAMEKEALTYLQYVLYYCRHAFGIDNGNHAVDKEFTEKTLPAQYEHLKHVHGDIYEYYVALQNVDADKQEKERIDSLITSARNSMYGAKSLKDAMADMEQMRNSSNDIKFSVYGNARMLVAEFYTDLQQAMDSDMDGRFNMMVVLYSSVQARYDNVLKDLYTGKGLISLDEIEIATIINFYRELHSSIKALARAAKDLLLTSAESTRFDELPGSTL